MIPRRPSPDDLAAAWVGRADFQQVVVFDAVLVNELGIGAGGDGLGAGFAPFD